MQKDENGYSGQFIKVTNDIEDISLPIGTFDQVAVIGDESGLTIGTPVVKGAKVEANVVKNGKGKKIRIFKYNPKKGYRKRQGHRQPYTKVEIAKITKSARSAKPAAEEATEAENNG